MIEINPMRGDKRMIIIFFYSRNTIQQDILLLSFRKSKNNTVIPVIQLILINFARQVNV